MEEKQRDVLIDHINKLVSGIGFVRELIEKMESEEPQLLPCPFCGGSGGHNIFAEQHWIKCMDCSNRTADWPNVDAAIEAWNRRV